MGVVGQCGTCWRLADKKGHYLKVYVNPNLFPCVAFTHGLCPPCLKIEMGKIKEYLARQAGLKKRP